MSGQKQPDLAGLNGHQHGPATTKTAVNEQKDWVRAAIFNSILPLSGAISSITVHWHHISARPDLAKKTQTCITHANSNMKIKGTMQRHSFKDQQDCFEVVVTEIVSVDRNTAT